ncbi:MAG TPA: diguanylate cyclase, partial [Bdellovibrionales bacterium]|nr:diguanylate cyclase [Bdellovibrionales bacterium]
MKKISLLILCIVVVSISSYAYFAVWQFKNDKLKYIHVVNSTFTSTIAKKIQASLDEIIGDMQNIVSLLGLKGIDREKSQVLMVIFQNNASFVSMNVFRAANAPTASPTPAPGAAGETPVIDEQPALQAGASPAPSPGATPAAEAGAAASPAPVAAPAPVPTEFSQSYALFNKDFLSLNQLTEDSVKTISLNEVSNYLSSAAPRKNPYFVDHPKMNFLTFVYPLDNANTYFAVFNVSKEFLYEAVAESEVNEPLVVDERGNVVMHVDRSKVGQFVNDLPIFELAKSNPFREGGMEFSRNVDGEDKSYVGNFYKIGYGLILVAQADKGRAFEGMQKIIFNTVLFAFDVVGIAIIIGVLFSKTLTAPLQKLMLVTENIAAGNYNVQADIKTNDEVGQLADYFVTLGKKLDEREAQLEKATELAIKDGMTGVFNHRHFRNRMTEFFNLAKRHDHELSLILTDIDFFKKFNDTYGHQ